MVRRERRGHHDDPKGWSSRSSISPGPDDRMAKGEHSTPKIAFAASHKTSCQVIVTMESMVERINADEVELE